MPEGYKMADWGGEPGNVLNRSDSPLFQSVNLDWARPQKWQKGKKAPVMHDDPCLYILQRDHGNAWQSMKIVYIGLTISPKTRFLNHPTAREVVAMRGDTYLSFAVVEFSGKNKESRTKRTLEQVEHLLIWALYGSLYNQKKLFTLPGLGANRGTAWHIVNQGYRFQGQMPKEIVYPWMLIKPGRDRSFK